MQALVLKDFGLMAIEELPTAVAAQGEVLLKIAATGICGSDIHGYTGENGRRVAGQVMGHESVGTVAAVGPGVESKKFPLGQAATFNPVLVSSEDAIAYSGREQHAPGKRVIGVAPELISSFAQYVSVPQENVVLLSETMPIVYGALIEPLAVALHAVRRSGVAPSDSLLIIGGGPIGQSVVLAARSEGITTIVVSEVDATRRSLCEQLGAEVIDPLAGPLADQVVAAFGSLADVTIDAVGISVTVNSALDATKLGGAVCLVGMGARRLDTDAYGITTEERTVIGSFTYSKKDFQDAATWVTQGAPELQYLISREVSLAEAPAAFAALAAQDGTPGKVIVRLDSEASTHAA
jgi:threonine dehydrogenase-like Zn-dependent dehydrogenase